MPRRRSRNPAATQAKKDIIDSSFGVFAAGATGGGLIGTFVAAGKVTDAMQRHKKATALTPEERLPRAKELMLERLQKAKSRKCSGKDKLSWLSMNSITATVPELDELIKEVNEATTWEEVKGVYPKVMNAIGMKHRYLVS